MFFYESVLGNLPGPSVRRSPAPQCPPPGRGSRKRSPYGSVCTQKAFELSPCPKDWLLSSPVLYSNENDPPLDELVRVSPQRRGGAPHLEAAAVDPKQHGEELADKVWNYLLFAICSLPKYYYLLLSSFFEFWSMQCEKII